MRKILSLAAIVAAFCAICSCSKEEIKLQLNTTEVTLYSLDEHTITSPNGTNVRFSTRDKNIATVNETTGVVTAITIGETIIDVTADQGKAEVKVTVKPKYNLYTEPCHDFTMTRSQIVAKYGTPDSDQGDIIGYIYESDKVHPIDMYSFDGNNKLKYSCAMISQDYATTLVYFLSERYITLGSSSGMYMWIDKVDNPKMSIAVTKATGYTLYEVLYMPYDGTKAAEFNVPQIDIPEELSCFAE